MTNKDLIEHIVLGLVPAQKNETRRCFCDLAITYYLLKEKDGESIWCPIDAAIADILGLSETELFELALDNTKRLLEPVIFPIPETDIWIGGNNKGANGAACLLYKTLIVGLSRFLSDSFYAVPIDKNYIMFFPAINTTPAFLRSVVTAAQKGYPAKDFLSNNIYFFHKDTMTFSIAKSE